MYKFLIKLRDGIDPVYEYLKENVIIDDKISYEEWTSSDLSEVEEKYRELLKKYAADNLKVVQDLTADIYTSVTDELGDISNYVQLINISATRGTTVISGIEEAYETNYGYYTVGVDGVTLEFINDEDYCYALFKTIPVNEEKDFTLHVTKETGLKYVKLEQPNVLISAGEGFTDLKKGLTDFSYEDDYSYVLVQGTKEDMNELYKIIKAYATYVYPSDTETTLRIPESEGIWILAYDDITFDVVGDATYYGDSINSVISGGGD